MGYKSSLGYARNRNVHGPGNTPSDIRSYSHFSRFHHPHTFNSIPFILQCQNYTKLLRIVLQ